MLAQGKRIRDGSRAKDYWSALENRFTEKLKRGEALASSRGKEYGMDQGERITG